MTTIHRKELTKALRNIFTAFELDDAILADAYLAAILKEAPWKTQGYRRIYELSEEASTKVEMMTGPHSETWLKAWRATHGTLEHDGTNRAYPAGFILRTVDLLRAIRLAAEAGVPEYKEEDIGQQDQGKC